MAALMLRPIGTLSMIVLMLHGAMGRLGEAAGVEGFEFQHMLVRPTLAPGRREIVVAFDCEVARLGAPIDIRVLDKPLYLLMPQPDESAIDTSAGVTDVQLTRTCVGRQPPANGGAQTLTRSAICDLRAGSRCIRGSGPG